MADRALTVTFIGNDAQLQNAFKRVGVGLSGLERTGQRLQSFGGAMSRNVTLPIVAIGAASAKMAMDFQSSTEKLRTQAGATQAQVEKLRQGMLKMASSVAQSPQELSAGMYHVVSSMNAVLPAASRASDELKILKTSAELASVGGANLEETSYALASAMNALHAPASQAGKIAGQLNAIVGAGDMTFQDLLDTMRSGLIPTARGAGLSLQSLGAALAVMGDMGMRGAMAGTRLRMSIALLSSPSKVAATVLDTLGMTAKQATSTSSAMAAALEQAGLRTTRLGADLKKPDGFMVALKDLNDHLRQSGLTATGAAAVMNKAFGGGRMGATISLLAQNTGRLQLKFDQIGKTAGNFGADWKATTQTAAFQWHAMLSTIQSDAIQLGNAVLPVVMTVANKIVGVVDSVSHAFESLPKALQSTIIKGGLILATIGPALKVLGMFTSALGQVKALASGDVGAVMGARPIAGGAGPAASAAARSSSSGLFSTIRTGVGTAVSRGLQGVAVAGIGTLISQTVGSAVHGAVGSAIKSIGTDASLGAGFGAIFGPAGMAGGALIGGLFGAVKHFIGTDAAKQGDEWASKFTSTLGSHVSKQVKDGLAKATTRAINTPKPGSQQAQLAAGNTRLILNPGQKANPQLYNRAFNQQFDQLYTAVKAAGLKAGQTFVQAWDSVKLPSEPMLLASVDRALNSVPAQIRRQGPGWVQLWKDQAAKQMLQYAVTLQQHGKLPLSAVQRLMHELEGQIPGFSYYLQNQGLTSDKAFAKALRFDAATATLKTTLTGYRKDFNDTSIAINLTGDNINRNVATAMTHLKQIIATSTGEARKTAIDDFNKLKDGVGASLTAMGAKTAQSVKDMKSAIESGTGNAAKIAASNMGNFAQNVLSAINSGAVGTGRGMNILISNLNKALRELGQKQLSQIQVGAMSLNVGKQQQLMARGAARGGLFQIGRPGEAGRDSVPLNVGGHPIVVAPGEQVAVFNRHQLPVVNAALAPMGGLPGLFQRVSRPNHMASGGIVGGGAVRTMLGEANAINAQHYPYVWGGGHNAAFSGPYDCSGAVSAVLHSAGLLNKPEVSGQLMNYGLPGPGAVTVYANPVHAFMSIDGRFFGTHGSSGAGWYAGSALPGFAVRHAPVGAGGGSLTAPSVRGGGVIGKIAQAAVKMATKAANGKLSKAFGAMTAGGGFTGGDWGTFGSVANQVSSFFGADGFNKIAIAGILGNAAQESSMNPNTPGGGLWQQISNFGSGTGGSLLNQMRTMLPQILGLRGAMNSAGSPGAAATIFEQGFEKAGIPAMANRIAAANAAYAAGYARGGLPFAGSFGKGGTIPGRRGAPSLAVVHGGEHVIPAFSGGGMIGSFASGPQDLASQMLLQSQEASAVRQQLNRNLKLLSSLQQALRDVSRQPKLRQEITTLRSEEATAGSTSKRAQLRAQITQLEGRLTLVEGKQRTALEKRIATVEGENQRLGGNKTTVGTGGLLGKLSKVFSVGIPSQGIGAQIGLASLSNATAAATNSGNVNAEKTALNAQIKYESGWLTKDKNQLRKVNRALRNRHLSRKQRGALLQDKLALIQEVGTIQGDLGSLGSSLQGLDTSSSTGGGSGSSAAASGPTPAEQAQIDAQNALAQAIQAQTQATQQLQQTVATQNAYMQSVGAVETGTAIKALSDVISGQIGGRAYSRMTGSAGDGSVARY